MLSLGLSLTTIHNVPPNIYFVNSVGGDDGNSGLSSGSAKATWAGLESIGDLTGANISIAASSVFREQISIPNNARVIVADGGRAIVSGADVLPNASFVSVGGSVYQISLPSIPTTVNSYASVSNADVLMVWENNIRLGSTMTKKTSVADVQAAPGSFWWDTTSKILYVHATDSSDITANGRIYEASVRTLAIHGGDGFYVEGLIGEKAGAKTTTGQQGYGILGYKSGTYKRCVGRWGWNHCGGVANSENSNPLIFDTCEFYDHERQTESAVSTCFVAYKSSSSAAQVVIRDCYVHMPTYDAAYSDIGFYAHGSAVQVTWDGTNFTKNFRYGRQLLRDAGFVHASHAVSDILVAESCKWGDYLTNTSGVTETTVVAKGCTGAATDTRLTGAVNLRAIDCLVGATANGAGVVVSLPSAKIIRTNAPSGNNDGIGLQTSNASKMIPTMSMFYRVGSVYDGGPGINPCDVGTDNNDFSGFVRIYQNTAYSPSYSTSLATWQSVSGLDASSLVTSNIPAGADFDLPVWTGVVLGGD